LNLLVLGISYVVDRSRNNQPTKSILADDHKPVVTVQLPVYNEMYVVDRLIDTVAKFDWPSDKLEIQILDDSTDETVERIKNKVEEWKAKGVDIVQIQREDRVGFKAGALAYGTSICKGEFIAVFDADFLPEKDFLLNTIPHFQNDEIGVVQTKWGHINRDYSMLTKMQAFALDAHFRVEQRGRNAGGHFINFNGTAGVWRKTCIADAGGWQADTLTEDLDLSYRAQIKGWKFKYLEEVESPAELPVTMNALKTQQFRWSKGAAECTRKNLGKVLKQKGIGLSTKLNAVFHLMNSFMFLAIISLVLLSVPMIMIMHHHPEYGSLYSLLRIFFVTTIMLAVVYFIANRESGKNIVGEIIKFLVFFPTFLTMTMGIAISTGIGVFEGYIGKKSPFIRTPKFNVSDKRDSWEGNRYTRKSLSPMALIEFAIAIYALVGILLCALYGNIYMIPFMVMIALGFAYTGYFTIKHAADSR